MKKPCGIKKGIIECMDEAIVVSETGDAHDLSDFADKAHVCMAATLTYIQQLEQELAAVKLERDAAVRDITDIVKNPYECIVCAHFKDANDEYCLSCLHRSNWKWRGVCPENTEVQK